MKIQMLLVMVGLSMPAVMMASMETVYNQGLQMGESLKKANNPNADATAFLKDSKGSAVERARAESQMTVSVDALQAAALSELKLNAAGRLVVESERERPKFSLTPKTVVGSCAASITRDAPTIVKNQNQNCIEVPFLEALGEKTVHLCEVSREPEIKHCIHYLQEPTVTVIPAKYSNYWCSAGNHRPDDPRCGAKTYYSPARMYQAEQVTVSEDVWVSQCQALDALKECQQVSKTCLEPNETRIINEKPITKPCWKEEHRYSCQYPSKNNCEQYHTPMCHQIGSDCQFLHEGKCYIWTHKYECATQPGILKTKRVCGKDIFCITGDCHKNAYQGSQDFLEVMAQLSIFEEIQTKNTQLSEIFKGTGENCKVGVASFKSCCKLEGWGVGLGLADCSAEEKALAEKREKKLCHEVGRYKTKKLVGLLREEKTAFCCFHSKLMRIIHEQGRLQLGLSWGEPEQPQCRGFTLEELSRLDFSKLDLSELFSDIQASTKAHDVGRMQKRVEERLNNIQQGFGKEEQKHP